MLSILYVSQDLHERGKSKAPVSQLVNVEVNSGNHKAVLASNYTLQLRIRGHHVGMKCGGPGLEI